MEYKKHKVILWIGVFLILFAIAGNVYYYFFYKNSIKPTQFIYKSGDIKKITPTYVTTLPSIDFFINNNHFSVEVARTKEEQALGLGGREGLNGNAGMLFIFSKPAPQIFWMKDMKISIDIVWIDKNKKVIGFAEGARPEDFPKTYQSPANVSYVLEIGSGEVQKRNIKIGDAVIFDSTSVQK